MTMNRVLLVAAAALALAGCGDAENPVSAHGARPSATGGALPNLYTASMTLTIDEFGDRIAVIQVCNNGASAAGASETNFQYRRNYVSGTQLLYTPSIGASDCADVESYGLPTATSLNDRYIVKVDDDHVVTESNESDNETRFGS